MRRSIALLLIAIGLAACRMDPSGGNTSAEEPAAASNSESTQAAGLGAHDPAPGQPLDPSLADDRPRPVMQLQVVLDRLGYTPGVIDGEEGLSTRNAIAGFQEAEGLRVTGQLDDATRAKLARWSNIPATRVITIPPDFAAGPFLPLPDEPAAQAKLPALGYETLDEKLAERFHTTVETLVALNSGATDGAGHVARASDMPSDQPPQAHFRSGQTIRVPNIGADRIDPASVRDAAWLKTLTSLGVGSQQPKAERIVVSKSKGTLKAYDEAGRLVAMFTATMGSRHDPLPLGSWKVKGIAYNPPFHYNPELFWDVSDSKDKEMLPPGPNGPVGVAWIDLDKEHYGIHGTPHPETIGRAESHGCVRLTNWDVARLAQMVAPGTRVLFQA